MSRTENVHVHGLFEVPVELAPEAEGSEEDALVDHGMQWLTKEQCHHLLGAASFGRVGVSVAGVAMILPATFAMMGDDVVFVTGEGTKLDAARASKIMTFQIDAFDAARRSGWSVLVVGNGEELDPSELRGHSAETHRPAAPGLRHKVVRIRTDMVTGRRFGPQQR